MNSMMASQIAQVMGGSLSGEDILVTAGPSLKSSEVEQGGIFLAIQGEKVDGHDFVEDAFSHGAVLAISTRAVAHRHILVSDVTAALTLLARFARSELKDLLRHMLSQHGETIAPTGNYNNELGVPLTLLACSSATKYAIIEMGARHSGDIAHLASIAQPDIAVVLRVGMAHVGEFGSIEAIAKTKSELISSLSSSGIAILGQYDPYTKAMESLHDGRTIAFGTDHSDEVRATEIEMREGRPHFDLVTPAGPALRTLILFAQERGGRAWAFLGKMAELGESSATAHQQVGTLAYQMGIDHLVCVDAPEYQPAQQSDGQTNLHLCDRSGARAIAEQIEPGDVILVKASRSERFEILAEEIEEVVKRKITAGGEEE